MIEFISNGSDKLLFGAGTVLGLASDFFGSFLRKVGLPAATFMAVSGTVGVTGSNNKNWFSK